MAKFFNPLQKKIAITILDSPKTVDELNKLLEVPFDELNDNLKHMLKLKVVKVDGYPQKYSLVENIKEAVMRRKEIQEKDPFDLRIKAIIEFRAIEEDFLNKKMDELEKKLKGEKGYTIYAVYRAKPIEEDGTLTSYLELNISAKDFTELVKFMYFYGLSSVEVLRPKKVVLSMDDLQDGLMEMSEMIHSYNNAMLRSMSKDELNEFSKSLYTSKDSQ